MSKFKVGDKVRVLGSPAFSSVGGKVGDIGEIVRVSYNDAQITYLTVYFEGRHIRCDFYGDSLELVKPKKEQPDKYAVVTETFVDKKELRKYLKEHKEEKPVVYSVKKKVDYRVTSVVSYIKK